MSFAAKILEAEQLCRSAEKAARTTIFRWKADYDTAADDYNRAAQCYRSVQELLHSKNCYMLASDCYKKNKALFHSAKALENAIIVSKDISSAEETFRLAGEAASLYQQHGSGDSGANILDKAAKIIEDRSPELAFKLYHQAADVSSGNEKKKRYTKIADNLCRIFVMLKALAVVNSESSSEDEFLTSDEDDDADYVAGNVAASESSTDTDTDSDNDLDDSDTTSDSDNDANENDNNGNNDNRTPSLERSLLNDTTIPANLCKIYSLIRGLPSRDSDEESDAPVDEQAQAATQAPVAEEAPVDEVIVISDDDEAREAPANQAAPEDSNNGRSRPNAQINFTLHSRSVKSNLPDPTLFATSTSPSAFATSQPSTSTQNGSTLHPSAVSGPWRVYAYQTWQGTSPPVNPPAPRFCGWMEVSNPAQDMVMVPLSTVLASSSRNTPRYFCIPECFSSYPPPPPSSSPNTTSHANWYLPPATPTTSTTGTTGPTTTALNLMERTEHFDKANQIGLGKKRHAQDADTSRSAKRQHTAIKTVADNVVSAMKTEDDSE